MRVFTVNEANALLPRLNVLLERQMTMLRDLDALSEKMATLGLDPYGIELTPEDTPELTSLKSEMRDHIKIYHAGWREIEALGLVVKDYRMGLIDFQGRRGTELVWWCWKYGEPAVSHWHPLDEGFDTRRPLERMSIPPTLN
jgi:hypothetical protein